LDLSLNAIKHLFQNKAMLNSKGKLRCKRKNVNWIENVSSIKRMDTLTFSHYGF